ncbi:MAG TPA: hypothetical protein VE987_03100 [Polyangiaceae bacterium]|nr:hypothetical protein [Polyangiaceae bacterium]
MLAAHFQGYCRGLHSAAVDFIAMNTRPSNVAAVLRGALTQGRRLDTGNANPDNLGADFGRLGMPSFWDDVGALDRRNRARRTRLRELNEWRNAIAHHDFTRVGGRDRLHVTTVRAWRDACDVLASFIDRAVASHLRRLVGSAPW